MIYVLTVHWEDPRWIDIQLDYLKRCLTEPYQVYAFLNGIDISHSDQFDFYSDEPIASHSIKLNILAQIAAKDSKNPTEDLLLFLDGDAFPIGDLASFARSKLDEFPLLAVQRLENGDLQPHPSCCITTVKFWQDIKGDWKPGYKWKSAWGKEVTDVGGNLLGLLQNSHYRWLPMLRTNQHDLHPLFFGVYEKLVYHHGAGFRPAFTRLDEAKLKKYPSNLLGKFTQKLMSTPAIVKVSNLLGYESQWIKTVKRNSELSNHIFDCIKTDDQFITSNL